MAKNKTPKTTALTFPVAVKKTILDGSGIVKQVEVEGLQVQIEQGKHGWIAWILDKKGYPLAPLHIPLSAKSLNSVIKAAGKAICKHKKVDLTSKEGILTEVRKCNLAGKLASLGVDFKALNMPNKACKKHTNCANKQLVKQLYKDDQLCWIMLSKHGPGWALTEFLEKFVGEY